jgi:hypothetical protein
LRPIGDPGDSLSTVIDLDFTVWGAFMEDWAKGAIVGVIGALGVAGAGFASKNEELHVHLVEIAFGILRADPKEGVTPARSWAIDVIQKNSGVNFSDEDRAALLSKPILDKDIYDYKMMKGNDWKFLPYSGLWADAPMDKNGHVDWKKFFEDTNKDMNKEPDKAAPPK